MRSTHQEEFMSRKSTLQNFRYVWRALLHGAVISAFLIQTTPLTVDAGANDRSTLKNYQHVFIIMMENTGFDALIGNSNAPFINTSQSAKLHCGHLRFLERRHQRR
jgi:phospholipase C